jgi:hypothetical protein
VKHRAVTSFCCLLLVAIVGDTGGCAIGNALRSSPPLLFAGICLFGAAIFVGTAGLCAGALPDRGGRRRHAAVVLLLMAVALGAGLAGRQHLAPGTGTPIFFAMPLWLIAMEWTSNRQNQPLVDVVAMTCGMLGLGLLASGTATVTTSHDILGLALLSIVTFSWAAGTSIRRRSPGDLDPWCRAVFQMATAGAVVIAASLALERRLDWMQVPILAWPLLFNLMMTTGLAFVAWHRALATGTAQRENDLARAKPVIRSEHHMETSDAGCNTFLSSDEDRRGGRPFRLVYRRLEPVYGQGGRLGAAGGARARSPRLLDRPGVSSQARKV